MSNYEIIESDHKQGEYEVHNLTTGNVAFWGDLESCEDVIETLKLQQKINRNE